MDVQFPQAPEPPPLVPRIHRRPPPAPWHLQKWPELKLKTNSSRMAATANELKIIACEAIDKSSKDLQNLSHEIWKNPELNFKETKCHAILTEFFKNNQFEVTPSWTLETAFRAKYGGNKGPGVGIICEYDALPEIGHACGHNLIAEAGAAAALGIQAALKETDNKLGQLFVVGTPAEEMGGGKVHMVEKGCFKDIDFSMMVHPYPRDAVRVGSLATRFGYITYKGQSAHASLFPWQGTNALDAAVMAYSSVSMMRQQMKPTWRVHGVILEGGVKCSIIPSTTKMEYCLRAPNKTDLNELVAKVEGCFQAAAKATGCSVKIEWVNLSSYLDLNINPKLADIYKSHAASQGVTFVSLEEEAKMPQGSTDMGNVSHAVPSIQPFYSIGTSAPNHSPEFAEAAATDIAHEKTIIAAKAMAMTAIDVMSNPHTLETVHKQFIG